MARAHWVGRAARRVPRRPREECADIRPDRCAHDADLMKRSTWNAHCPRRLHGHIENRRCRRRARFHAKLNRSLLRARGVQPGWESGTPHPSAARPAPVRCPARTPPLPGVSRETRAHCLEALHGVKRVMRRPRCAATLPGLYSHHTPRLAVCLNACGAVHCVPSASSDGAFIDNTSSRETRRRDNTWVLCRASATHMAPPGDAECGPVVPSTGVGFTRNSTCRDDVRRCPPFHGTATARPRVPAPGEEVSRATSVRGGVGPTLSPVRVHTGVSVVDGVVDNAVE